MLNENIIYPKINKTSYILALQHVLAMFGATVLVPFITGMDSALALLCAGIGTLIFHFTTKKIVPVFLGSSFAFITSITIILANYSFSDLKGAIIIAGCMYIIYAIIIKIYGNDRVLKLFPPIVIGPIIMCIGLRLVPVALSMSGYNNDKLNYESIGLALLTLFVMITISFLQKSIFRFMPIMIAIFVGYILSLILGIVDLSKVINAPWIGLPSNTTNQLFTMPTFNLGAIFIMIPITLVTFLEHIGDIKTNGAVVGKNFAKSPGFFRTLLGDAFATMVAGFLGGPPNTTYGENTAVLAATKNYDPRILRISAVFAICLAFCGKITAIMQSLPTAIMGGVSLMLFALISSIGIKVMMEAKINFNNYRNLVIPSVIIIFGVFVNNVKITDEFIISGLFLATIFGVLLNKVLPQ